MLDLFHTHGCEVFMQGMMFPAMKSKNKKLPSTKSRSKYFCGLATVLI